MGYIKIFSWASNKVEVCAVLMPIQVLRFDLRMKEEIILSLKIHHNLVEMSMGSN